MSVHNDEDRVEQAVASILAQTFDDFELIVIDDGSSDGSGRKLDELAAADSRVRIIHQHNTGLTKALIRGCNEARGEFIARQDSDDWSHPSRIADQVAVLTHDLGVGFVSCATQYIGPRGEPLVLITRNADSVAATHGLLEERLGPPAHGSVLFRRSLYERVGGYRPQFHFAQDADLWLRMGEVARIAYVPETRYVHVRETDSTSGMRRPVQRQFGELAHLCRQARISAGDEGELLAKAGTIAASIRAGGSASRSNRGALADAAYFIGAQLTANRDARARPYLLQAIGIRPWHWKAWVRLLQTLVMKSAPEARSFR
jgi:glycosyltransferase involved in cell wall biosynthesis